MKDEQRKESFGTMKPVSEGHIRTARGNLYIVGIISEKGAQLAAAKLDNGEIRGGKG